MAKKSSNVVREAPAVVPGMMRSTKEQRAQEDRWRAESDMDTLSRAEEIRKDRKRHTAAQAIAREKIECMKEVAGGRKK